MLTEASTKQRASIHLARGEQGLEAFASSGIEPLEGIKRLRAETGEGFPERVTAFREGMAVHGRYGHLCPVCGTPVQRIVYAENEANYCPTCQTGGKVLADRALSRLLGSRPPKNAEELKERRGR